MSQVHHTRGVAAGHDPRWLVGSCPPCNVAIGDPTRSVDPAAVPVTRW